VDCQHGQALGHTSYKKKPKEHRHLTVDSYLIGGCREDSSDVHS